MLIHPWKVSNFAKLPEGRRQLVVDHEAALVAWGLMEGMEVKRGERARRQPRFSSMTSHVMWLCKLFSCRFVYDECE